MDALRVGVLGAGLIGTYVGARLAATGVTVTLVGRDAVLEPLRASQLVLDDVAGPTIVLSPGRLELATEARALAACDVVILATKSAATGDAAITLKGVLRENTPVVSLQNGVENPERIRAALGRERAYGGVVSFNVVRSTLTDYKRTTSGPVVLERLGDAVEARSANAVGRLATALNAAGIATERRADFARVAWSKLVLNLNNAVNALSGLPLREELSQRAYRVVLAASMREGLAVMRALGVRPAWLGTLYPPLAARALPLPDVIFKRAAAAMLRIDPAARSSMSDDLAACRGTEIDDLNGAVVRHGARLGVATPVNAHIVELVRAAERAALGSPRLAAAELLPPRAR